MRREWGMGHGAWKKKISDLIYRFNLTTDAGFKYLGENIKTLRSLKSLNINFPR